MVMVVIMVVIAVSVATCPLGFKIATPALGLAAVLTVFTFSIVHLVFGFAYPLLAFTVIIPVKRLHRDGPSQKRENDERRKHCFYFIQHATSWCRSYLIVKTNSKLPREPQRPRLIAV
jgi:hypothetical protein